MADQEIGFVEITATTRIVFAVGSWKGQSRGSIRKFVASEKYTGPTKSGMSLDGTTVVDLLAALRLLQSMIPTKDKDQHISVGKSSDWEIRVTVVPPDEENNLPSIDIREFVETSRYTGPTKAGIRFAWDKLKQFSQLLEVLVQQLGVAASSERTLFPGVQPKWVTDAKEATGPNANKPAPPGFDVASLKVFPDAFLSDGQLEAETIQLSIGRLAIIQDRDGHHYVTDDSDFRRRVRNEVEGKFFVYAQKRFLTEIRLPREMFKVFSAVANYEKYCRELRQKVVRDLEVRSRNRTLAVHVASQTLETHGVPIC